MSVLSTLRHPIVAAPMAGGPSTPALAAAVSAAGGLGFLAAGMIDTDRLVADVAEVAHAPTGRSVSTSSCPTPAASTRPPSGRTGNGSPEAGERGVTPGRAVGGDDAYPDKLAALLPTRSPVVSFVFGLPDRAAVAALRERGTEVWATVTRPDAATAAAGWAWTRWWCRAPRPVGIVAAAGRRRLRAASAAPLVAAGCDRPLVAAGGIVDGPAVAGVLAAGAAAAQLGTAFLRCPEAGSSPMHRAAVAGSAPTALTRAFTGKRARGVVNDFLRRTTRRRRPATRRCCT